MKKQAKQSCQETASPRPHEATEVRFDESFDVTRSVLVSPIGTYPERDDYIAKGWKGEPEKR